MQLIINAERTGYEPGQIRSTMTVGELIEALSEYDEDTPVYTAQDGGYTYGGLSYDSFEEYEGEEEPEC